MRRPLVLLVALACSLITSPLLAQCVSLTTLGAASTQNFNTLSSTAGSTTNNLTITGWFMTETGGGARDNEQYAVDNGGSNTGDTYSYGAAGNTERALGGLQSGTLIPVIGACFTNNTGATIASLDIAYTGEEWRLGTTARTDQLDFEYSTNATSLTTGAWTAVNALDFVTPDTGTVGPKDGNAAATRTAISSTIPALSIANGATFWIRWNDANASGADDGLAVDDFSLTPQGGIVTPSLNISDVTLAEGNPPGTTTFTFAVTLTAPAGPGGVTYDIATADGTAQDDNPVTEDNDYVAQSLTGQSIAAGSTGPNNFSVTVNRDAAAELNETFFVNVTSIVGASAGDTQGLGTINNDDVSVARIHDVQGNGAATPIPGATVTVEGVVIGNFQGTGRLQGFFLQEEDADVDADPATSEGIFIFCNSCPTAVAEGQRVQATGAVSEFNGTTEITASTAGSVVITNAGNNLAQVTPASIDLPIAGVINDFYEAREGMLVTFVDTLTVSEYFELARFGHIELFEGGRPRQFTEVSPPSVAGLAAHNDNLDRRRVILDDDNNVQNVTLTQADGSQFIFHPRANGGFSVGTQGVDFFRGGDVVNGLTGVLHWSFPGTGADTWRIRPTAATPATFTVANPRPATPPAVGGAIKAVSMNTLNYFTTVDTTSSNNSGTCGPSGTQDCRGADSTAELNRQRERLSIVICGLNADVYGLNEIENTASSTLTDLLGAVNTLCGGAHPYAFVNTGGTLGTDAIRVALIYRTGILSPVGPALVDLDSVHNRPPTAQTFDVVDAANPAFGERFTVIANHFKSKGCPGTGADADAGDGASCFNGTRVDQANRLISWTTGTVIPAAGDPDVLLLGDFNSYAQEDPVTAIEGAGYTDLETALLGASAYSYLFDGQLGHLDYAFSSSSLTPQVTGVGAWHINADEASLFDYNDEIKDTGENQAFEEKPDGSALVPPRVLFQPASPYRAADHDPVLVGLFQVADLSITKTDGVTTATPGGSVTYTITASNAGPDPVTGGTVTDTFPAILTCTWTCVGAGGGTCTAAGSGNISDTVNLPVGGSVTYTASCTIAASALGTLVNTATVSGGAAGDPDSGNNSATDTDTLTPQADLAITKTDGVTTVDPGGSLTYTITASNNGPSDAPGGASVADTFPAELTCTWTCAGSGPGSNCNASGSGNISEAVQFPAGGSVTFTVSCTVSPAASGTISNTATVNMMGGGPTDPNPNNNSATDSDTVSSPLGDYFTITACRAVDTRPGSPLQNGVPVDFALKGVCGIPVTATSVVVNVTALGATGSGDLTFYASDATPPAFSALPFPAGITRSLFAIVSLSSDAAGEVTVLPVVSGNGTVDVLLDVMGYFE